MIQDRPEMNVQLLGEIIAERDQAIIENKWFFEMAAVRKERVMKFARLASELRASLSKADGTIRDQQYFVREIESCLIRLHSRIEAIESTHPVLAELRTLYHRCYDLPYKPTLPLVHDDQPEEPKDEVSILTRRVADLINENAALKQDNRRLSRNLEQTVQQANQDQQQQLLPVGSQQDRAQAESEILQIGKTLGFISLPLRQFQDLHAGFTADLPSGKPAWKRGIAQLDLSALTILRAYLRQAAIAQTVLNEERSIASNLQWQQKLQFESTAQRQQQRIKELEEAHPQPNQDLQLTTEDTKLRQQLKTIQGHNRHLNQQLKELQQAKALLTAALENRQEMIRNYAIHKRIVQDHAALIRIGTVIEEPVPFERDGVTYQIISASLKNRKAGAKIADSGSYDQMYKDFDLTDEDVKYFRQYSYEWLITHYGGTLGESSGPLKEPMALDGRVLHEAFTYACSSAKGPRPSITPWSGVLMETKEQYEAMAAWLGERFSIITRPGRENRDEDTQPEGASPVVSGEERDAQPGQVPLLAPEKQPEAALIVVQPPQPEPEASTPVEEVETLKLNLTTATERLDRVEESREVLRLEDEYKRKVMALSNQLLSGAQKIVFLAAREYIFSLRDRASAEGQFIHIPFKEITRTTGLSADIVGTAMKRLHSVGLVVREEREDPEKKAQGKKQTQIFVALTLLAYSLELAPTTGRRNHGGDTRYCKFCGSLHLVRRKKVTVVCKECHREQEDPIEIEEAINSPDPRTHVVRIVEESPAKTDRQLAARCSESDETQKALPQLSTDETIAGQPTQSLWQPLKQSPDAIPGQEMAAVKLLQQTNCAICQRDKNRRVISWFWSEEHGGEYICTVCRSPLSLSEPVAEIADQPPAPQDSCELCWRDHQIRITAWVWIEDGGDASEPAYCCKSCFSPYAATIRERRHRQQEESRQLFKQQKGLA